MLQPTWPRRHLARYQLDITIFSNIQETAVFIFDDLQRPSVQTGSYAWLFCRSLGGKVDGPGADIYCHKMRRRDVIL